MFIVIVGPPGAGKGTQGEKLAKHLNAPWLSTGDMLRSAQQSETTLGLEAKQYVEKGELVPDQVVIGIVSDRLQESDCQKACLFDGFPRTVAQAEALDELLQGRKTPLSCALELKVPEDILLKRLLERKRHDDTRETISNRLKIFVDSTKPVLDYYRGKGILRSISGIGEVDEVHERILKCLEEFSPGNE